MKIDLNFNEIYEIDVVEDIPKSYYENTKVQKLDNVKVVGKFYYNANNELAATLSISGIMVIEDDISLESIDYPYEIEYDDILEENIGINQNTLDLFEFLWENIVLEVPLKFTKVMNLSEFHGDGWRLIGEDELIQDNNPFNELLKDFDKKE